MPCRRKRGGRPFEGGRAPSSMLGQDGPQEISTTSSTVRYVTHRGGADTYTKYTVDSTLISTSLSDASMTWQLHFHRFNFVPTTGGMLDAAAARCVAA